VFMGALLLLKKSPRIVRRICGAFTFPSCDLSHIHPDARNRLDIEIE
jgi:hypothetical protein